MTQRDESDSERAGGTSVTSAPRRPRGAPEVAAGSLSVALELVRGMRFDVAQLRLQLAHDDVHSSCMHDG